MTVIIDKGNIRDFFPYGKYEKSGAYSNRESAINGADWWSNQGYEVLVKKQGSQWYHYRRRKE